MLNKTQTNQIHMKTSKIYLLGFVLTILLVNNSCEEKPMTLATVNLTEVTEIGRNYAFAGGVVVDDGGHKVVYKGLCWSISPDPTIENMHIQKYFADNNFSLKMDGLYANTTYYVRAYATGDAGTAYSNSISFKTLPASEPIVKNQNAQNVTYTSASFGGRIIDNGGEPILNRGICWGTNPNPTIENSKVEFSKSLKPFYHKLSDLNPNTTYYFRSFATNTIGTGYAEQFEFRTLKGTVTDIDGNIYPTVQIGSQEWMAENLQVTHYRNGDEILDYGSKEIWGYEYFRAAYCMINNDPEIKSKYGLVYTFYAATDSRGLCPDGWHVPSMLEWNELISYLGGQVSAKNKMLNRSDPELNYNASGLNGLPTGFVDWFGYQSVPEYSVYWWTSTMLYQLDDRLCHYVSFGTNTEFMETMLGNSGLGIRCLKD